ncbi:hypothetical protein BSKO_01581 [Bryopsis sp. KO-2023]|nr:hypothetical protein BSKO_01581 [Bryopsis sp. KO-2023]
MSSAFTWINPISNPTHFGVFGRAGGDFLHAAGGSTSGTLMETDLSQLPLPILSLCLSRLCPADLPSMACAQAVCNTFRQAGFEALRDVKEVNLSPENRLTEIVLPQGAWLLKSIPAVKYLEAMNCSPFPLVKEVSACKHLVDLKLSHCNLSDVELVQILSTAHCQPTMPRLQKLSLESSGGAISGEGWLSKRTLPKLHTLNLAWCHNILPSGVAELGPQLQDIDLHGCSLVDDSVCENLKNVRFLDLCFTSVTDDGLKMLVSAEAMVTLSLSADHSNLWVCGEWTNNGLIHLKQRRPDLEVILSSC